MAVLDRLLSSRQPEPHPGWSAREWRACETAERWIDEGRDDDARKLLAGVVSAARYADYLSIVHPPEPPALAPEPGEVTRISLSMPGEFDPADPAHVGRMLAAATRQSPGQVWQPETALRDPETGRWTVVVAIEPDDEPDREEVGLAADSKPADAPKLAAWLESQGRELTSFEPFSHRATSARLLPFTAKLRTQIGAYIKTPPWDISVALRWKPGRDEASQYEVSTVNITAPLAVPAEKRRALWLELARDLIPQVRGTTWWVDDGPRRVG